PTLSFKEIITPNTTQLFGNIVLEHQFNSEFDSLAISANYFSHKTYLSFEKMMELVLKD
ncbi:MAG: hypothetical protein IT245_09245, partial [Bacteroidia bacterium]|nr:hypothetical protein [Bacteroidia bacterium]